MTERPIIFSAPMIRALLASRKTQTRRLLRFPPWAMENGEPLPVALVSLAEVGGCAYYNEGMPRKTMTLRWRVGDRLWVREAWGVWPATLDEEKQVLYRATVAECPEGWPPRRGPIAEYVRWRPSIFMPRWASRITLDVTSVRVERLQDITWDDALAEGMAASEVEPPCEAFARLWDGINGKRADWASNPWVCVVGFKRVEAGQ